MTEEELETAKQLVKHPNFRWEEGMVDPEGCLFAGTDEYEIPVFWSPDAGMFSSLARIPDISHPATKGCLLALARELWESPRMLPETRRNAGWVVYPHRSGMLHFVADSEGIALARAVIKAPK